MKMSSGWCSHSKAERGFTVQLCHMVVGRMQFLASSYLGAFLNLLLSGSSL
jgi:hypothetical protein